jgi:hypothetical protein
MQVDKPRSNSKKEKEKIHISTGEWRIIMSAINHGIEVPANSRREVLMGYQYALHQHKKKLREERDMFMRSRDDNSTSSGGYWDEYSDASECSMERHRDPKHNRRTIAQTREESYAKSLSTPAMQKKEYTLGVGEEALGERALGPSAADGILGLFLLPARRPGRRFTGADDEATAAAIVALFLLPRGRPRPRFSTGVPMFRCDPPASAMEPSVGRKKP